jgi:hypothetical protein
MSQKGAEEAADTPAVGPSSRRGRLSLATVDAHQSAIAKTLALADEAAAQGDYADALAWLAMVEALGDNLPERYVIARRGWRAAAGLAG